MNTVAARFAAERRFYVAAAIGIVIIALAGFSIDVDLLRDMSGLSALVRLHGLVMFGWIALFVAQTTLVARHRVDWHRHLGVFGAEHIPTMLRCLLPAILLNLLPRYAALPSRCCI